MQWCAEKRTLEKITRDSFSFQTKLSVDGIPDIFTHKKLWYFPAEKGIECFGSRVWVWVSQSWGLFSMHFAPQCTIVHTCHMFSKHTKYNIAMLYFVCFENMWQVCTIVHCGAKCIENRPQLWLTQTHTLLPKHSMPFSAGKYQSFLCVNISGMPSTDNFVWNEKLSLVIFSSVLFSAHHCTQT